MTYHGEVHNGLIVLDPGATLPDGTRVAVEVAEGHDLGSEQSPQRTLYDVLEPIVGAAKGLPPDLAENHDHYLHGQPRR